MKVKLEIKKYSQSKWGETFMNNIMAFIIVYSIIFFQTSCTTNFNPNHELNRIDKVISEGEVDSIAGHNEEEAYKYWISNGIIIKLAIYRGGAECAISEEYYFRENGNVFANKRNEISLPVSLYYRTKIIFNDTNIVNEEYWLLKNDSEKYTQVSKLDMQKHLDLTGYSIEEEILKDEKSKKIKGILTVKDFAERFNFKIPEKEDAKSQITENNADKDSNIRDEEKILFFEDLGHSFKFTFNGSKVEILHSYAGHEDQIEKAQLKDGKIITEYGYSDTYVITLNSVCVANPETETGEDCYVFIRKKSTHEIAETINPELNQNTNINNSNSTKQFDEIQLTLLDASIKKVKIYLGEPSKQKFFFGHATKGFMVYFNKVANPNSEPKHLVLFTRANGYLWGDDAKVEEVYCVEDNQKACFGIHCLKIKDQMISTNTLD